MKLNKKIIKTEIIENFIKENKLTITKFCKLSNISYLTYKKVMSNTLYRLTPLIKIAYVIRKPNLLLNTKTKK